VTRPGVEEENKGKWYRLWSSNGNNSKKRSEGKENKRLHKARNVDVPKKKKRKKK
jgi:hypothetical protein